MKDLWLCLAFLAVLVAGFLLAGRLQESPPLRLGITLAEAERQVGRKLVLSPALIDYWPPGPTAEQLARDGVKGVEFEPSPGVTVYLGFNAANVLVEVRRMRSWELPRGGTP